MIETIEDDDGEIWFMLNGKAIMYFDKNGSLYTSGDISAFSKIPSPPNTKNNNQTLITDYYKK